MSQFPRRSRAAWLLGALLVLAGFAAAAVAAELKSAGDIVTELSGDSRGGVPAGKTECGRISLPIQFEYNSAAISSSSFEQLRQIAVALQDAKLRASAIRVEGHTDQQGSAAYNQALSERRAAAVKRYLVENEGVAASRLESKGYGKSRPLPEVSQDTEEGRAQNRRVELVRLCGATVVPSDAKLSVTLSVQSLHSGKQHVLTPGAMLSAGDNYRIIFSPNRDSYVYVFRIDPHGQAEPLFPNPQYSPVRNPAKADESNSVPSSGHWFTVGDVAGDGAIIVVASEAELQNARDMALRVADEALAASRGPAPNPRGSLATPIPDSLFWYRLPFRQQ